MKALGSHFKSLVINLEKMGIFNKKYEVGKAGPRDPLGDFFFQLFGLK